LSIVHPEPTSRKAQPQMEALAPHRRRVLRQTLALRSRASPPFALSCDPGATSSSTSVSVSSPVLRSELDDRRVLERVLHVARVSGPVAVDAAVWRPRLDGEPVRGVQVAEG